MSSAAEPPLEGDKILSKVRQLWFRNGLKNNTIAAYCRWVQAFRQYCRHSKTDELADLTLTGAGRFARYYARKRRVRLLPTRFSARSALNGWSNGLAALGVSVPAWNPTEPSPCAIRDPILRDFIVFRQSHAGVSSATLKRDQSASLEFLEFLHRRKRTCRTVRLLDIDAFGVKLRQRLGVASLALRLCSLRALLRFLHVSGHLRYDLATSVAGPPLKRDRNPPRALPWPDVQRILQAVDRNTPDGRRSYAILLLMSLYGLGGAEVVGLRLEDIDWDRKTIFVCRPKTQSSILLPLLPAAARALASYLQRSRPKPCPWRQVFVRSRMPYGPFASSSAIRHILTKYGRKAGVTTGFLGSHILRHSQATRQVDLGTPLKVVGDILGHRNPESTSHYTRSAMRRLRDLALPLPHD